MQTYLEERGAPAHSSQDCIQRRDNDPAPGCPEQQVSSHGVIQCRAAMCWTYRRRPGCSSPLALRGGLLPSPFRRRDPTLLEFQFAGRLILTSWSCSFSPRLSLLKQTPARDSLSARQSLLLIKAKRASNPSHPKQEWAACGASHTPDFKNAQLCDHAHMPKLPTSAPCADVWYTPARPPVTS